MSTSRDSGTNKSVGWSSSSVWARTDEYERNTVKQLVVPSGTFLSVEQGVDGLYVSNNFGSWPAATPADARDKDELWLKLPFASKAGDLVKGANWNRPTSLQRQSPSDVLTSYKGALTLIEPDPGDGGLRAPQRGAVHALLGYWTTKRKTPATVVMPTGTGKTETMVALLVAARLPKLLVLVPSDALREQVASKFETLGVLQEYGVVGPAATRPVVGRIEHGFTDAKVAAAFADACNVIIATPQVIDHCLPDAKSSLLGRCSHLFVDEAHHVAARTWSSIREEFKERDVVLFTATPFREDGKHLQGRPVYTFPLREAQAEGYFSSIDYKSVIDFDDVDRAVAFQAIGRLREDLAAGYDHILMARVGSIGRLEDVLLHYAELAPDLEPVSIDSRMGAKRRASALEALRSRSSRIVVCVNMLGEGFDLPALKVAAVHDPQKSLGVTLQFIGRFTRTSSTGIYGPASAFVARTEVDIDRRLRNLYAEDSDWNHLLRDLTEAAVEQQQEISDFEEGFSSIPEEVDIRSLLPKLSAVVYRAPTDQWDPDRISEYFGEESLLTNPIGLNSQAGVAWCVVERRGAVRWGDIKTLEEVAYELYVLYFDRVRKLLYINNSANDGVFEDLAVAVLGPGAERCTGSKVYRVLADIDRLVPTNVGVIDVRDQFRRFSMHVGSDVTASFSDAEAGTKSQTNISGGGYRAGEHINMSASLKGRIWSPSTATSLKQWCDWCDGVGEKLIDETISIDSVIRQFLLPENLTQRPKGVLLGVEWPWLIHVQQSDTVRLSLQGTSYRAAYTDLVPDTSEETGPFRFTVSTPAWSVPYEAMVNAKGGIEYRCAGPMEIEVVRPRSQLMLSQWLHENGLVFLMDGDRVIEDNLLYTLTIGRDPFSRDHLVPMDWTGTNIRSESQTEQKLSTSIQFRAIAECLNDFNGWDVILDDDGSGEIADIVALRIDGNELVVRLVHCKYSHGDDVGTRVLDLYEVCGQAQKSVRWRRGDLRPFFRALGERARSKQKRTGVSPFEVGSARKLLELQDRALVLGRRVEMVIVQPGVSQTRATEQQLDLLSSTQAYLKTTIGAELTIWCSP